MDGLFGPYHDVAFQTLIIIVAALGVYVMFRAGLFAVPQAGLLAIGAYVAGLMSIHLKTALAVNLICGTLAATAVGFVLGAVLARLDGIQLAIATVAFNEIVALAILKQSFTGGPDGLTGIPLSTPEWLVMAVLAAVLLCFWRLDRTRFGLAIDALRGDQLVASHAGVSAARYRLALFAGCGALSGLSGALLAGYVGFIDPAQFSFDGEVQLLTMSILGGMTSYWGPLLGSLITVGMPQLGGALQEYRFLVNGALVVLVVAFIPGGLVSIPARIAHFVRLASRRLVSLPALEQALDEPPPDVVVESAESGPALETLAVRVEFGGLIAVRDVSLCVRSGELLGIIGPNGSGKTTLLNVISGALKPKAGSLKLDGASLTAKLGRPHQIVRAGLSRTFQGIRLLPELTVLENIVLGAHSRQKASFLAEMAAWPRARRARREVFHQARKMLVLAGLERVADESPSSLPYGHQRLVEIVRALMTEPRVLLLDEPMAGMTRAEKAQLLLWLRRICSTGVAIILVEHDLDLMAGCDRLVVLNFGEVIAEGAPADVMDAEEVLTAYVGAVA